MKIASSSSHFPHELGNGLQVSTNHIVIHFALHPESNYNYLLLRTGPPLNHYISRFQSRTSLNHFRSIKKASRLRIPFFHPSGSKQEYFFLLHSDTSYNQTLLLILLISSFHLVNIILSIKAGYCAVIMHNIFLFLK